MKIAYKNLAENLMRRDHVGDLIIDGDIILDK
jgi:hypothetical protein